MTQTFGTDSNNDLYIAENGNLAVLSGLPAVVGACQTASKAQLGEMVLANQLGIPNFQAVWVGAPNYGVFQAYLQRTLLSIPGVTEVKSLELRTQNNVLNYTAEIVSEFGTSEISNG